jgi:hypothetical protein
MNRILVLHEPQFCIKEYKYMSEFWFLPSKLHSSDLITLFSEFSPELFHLAKLLPSFTHFLRF